MEVLNASEADDWLKRYFFMVPHVVIEMHHIGVDGERPRYNNGNVQPQHHIYRQALEFIMGAKFSTSGSGTDWDFSSGETTFAIFRHAHGMAYFEWHQWTTDGGTTDDNSTRDFMPDGTFEALLKFCTGDDVREIAHSLLARSIVE